MAGRPRKSSIVKDIDEIKEEVKTEPVITPEIIEEAEKEPVEEVSNVKTGVVKTDPWLNVRNKPSFDGDIVGKLNDGDTVSIYEVKNGFAKISDSEEKWASLNFII